MSGAVLEEGFHPVIEIRVKLSLHLLEHRKFLRTQVGVGLLFKAHFFGERTFHCD